MASNSQHACHAGYRTSRYLGTFALHIPWVAHRSRYSHGTLRIARCRCCCRSSCNQRLAWCGSNHLGTRCVQCFCDSADCWPAMDHGESPTRTCCSHPWCSPITHIHTCRLAADLRCRHQCRNSGIHLLLHFIWRHSHSRRRIPQNFGK